MKRTGGREWKAWILENGSYKLVALFVTLILWVTILGRRDFVLSKDMDVEFLLPHSIAIAEANVKRQVTVKVSGPRMALKKFAQSPGTITIDLAKSRPGPVRAIITPQTVEVPFGVKVMSIVPDVIVVTLVAAASESEEEVVKPESAAPTDNAPKNTPHNASRNSPPAPLNPPPGREGK